MGCQAVHRGKSLVKKVSEERYQSVNNGSMSALVENAYHYKDYVFPDVAMLDEGHRYMPDVEEDLELIVKILDENVGRCYADLGVRDDYSEFAAREMPREKTGTARLMAGWKTFKKYAHKAVGTSEVDGAPDLAEGEEILMGSDDDDDDDNDDGSDDDFPFSDLMAARGKKWTTNNPPRGETLDEKLVRCRTLMTRTAVDVQHNMREARRRRLYAAAQLADPNIEDLEDNDSSSDGECEVASIRGKRREGDRIEYLIRWRGYDEDDDTWEPAYNLEYAKAKVAAFEKANK